MTPETPSPNPAAAELSAPAGPRLLYCHCQYAQVVPREVKEGVLRGLCQTGAAFEAVADLCEMAARRDPALRRLSQSGPLKIAACYPRAIKGLFHQGGADLSPETTEVLNMRTLAAGEVLDGILSAPLQPNLPSKTPA